jgi:hypothetical protein
VLNVNTRRRRRIALAFQFDIVETEKMRKNIGCAADSNDEDEPGGSRRRIGARPARMSVVRGRLE